MVPVKFNKNRHFGPIHQLSVFFAFANESISGKFTRIFHATNYDEYFGQKKFDIGSKSIGGDNSPSNPCAYCFTLLEQSPDGVTGYRPTCRQTI